MGVLESTKYKNIIRTISGSNNVVYNNDLELLCDTSSGSVSIDLNEIPDDFWSTQYKLYIRDLSNNASVNNITITAPIGHTIDNLSDVKIQDDGDGLIVRVGGNKSYVTNKSSASVTPSGCSFIEVTVLEIQRMIANDEVLECSFYKITDASDFDLGVIVQGISENKVSLYGTGLFLNPDYQNLGGDNVGVWNIGLVGLTAMTSICIWDGLHYRNLTGSVGTSPDGDVVNWEVMSKTIANTYVLESDYIEYDPLLDQILKRVDKRGNNIDWAINKGRENLSLFQWGNNDVTFNVVTTEGLIENLNNLNEFKYNTCSNGSVYNCRNNVAVVKSNSVDSRGGLEVSEYTGSVSNNKISNASFVKINNDYPPLSSFEDKVINGGYSNFDMILDLNSGIYDAVTKTLSIPAGWQFVGKVELINSNKTVELIENTINSRSIIFTTKVGEVTTFTTVAVGGASLHEITSNQAVGNILITGRTNVTDSVTITRNGTINSVLGKPNVYL